MGQETFLLSLFKSLVRIFKHRLGHDVKKNPQYFGLLPKLPRAPPPSLAFFLWDFFNPIFLTEITPQLGEINFTLGPNPELFFLFFKYCHSFAQNWSPSGTFKAVLIAIDMPKNTPDQA